MRKRKSFKGFKRGRRRQKRANKKVNSYRVSRGGIRL